MRLLHSETGPHASRSPAALATCPRSRPESPPTATVTSSAPPPRRNRAPRSTGAPDRRSTNALDGAALGPLKLTRRRSAHRREDVLSSPSSESPAAGAAASPGTGRRWSVRTAAVGATRGVARPDPRRLTTATWAASAGSAGVRSVHDGSGLSPTRQRQDPRAHDSAVRRGIAAVRRGIARRRDPALLPGGRDLHQTRRARHPGGVRQVAARRRVRQPRRARDGWLRACARPGSGARRPPWIPARRCPPVQVRARGVGVGRDHAELVAGRRDRKSVV